MACDRDCRCRSYRQRPKRRRHQRNEADTQYPAKPAQHHHCRFHCHSRDVPHARRLHPPPDGAPQRVSYTFGSPCRIPSFGYAEPLTALSRRKMFSLAIACGAPPRSRLTSRPTNYSAPLLWLMWGRKHRALREWRRLQDWSSGRTLGMPVAFAAGARPPRSTSRCGRHLIQI